MAAMALTTMPASGSSEGPIILETFGSLPRYSYRMDVSRWRSERSAPIDLAAFPPELSYIGRRFRSACGERCGPSISMPLEGV